MPQTNQDEYCNGWGGQIIGECHAVHVKSTHGHMFDTLPWYSSEVRR